MGGWQYIPQCQVSPGGNRSVERRFGILTAAKDALEIIPVKVLFESTIVLLGLIGVRVTVLFPFFLLISRRCGQDSMADDDEFVELAEYCVRVWRDMDSLNGHTEEAIKSLEKYIVPA